MGFYTMIMDLSVPFETTILGVPVVKGRAAALQEYCEPGLFSEFKV